MELVFTNLFTYCQTDQRKLFTQIQKDIEDVKHSISELLSYPKKDGK